MNIAMSSGHGLHIRGARGNPVPPQLDEVDEARMVVHRVAAILNDSGTACYTFNDDTSRDQSTNLRTIVNWHNRQTRDLDVSVHFNCYNQTARGTEVLYITQESLASRVSSAMAGAGPFTNRGAKYRKDLYFLNNTTKPAVLLEVCFCDNAADANNYKANFEAICQAIATSLVGTTSVSDKIVEGYPLDQWSGKASWFGGPNDKGVSPSEGLAFIYELDQAPDLFLPHQPPNTSGLARRLDPETFYIAMRWDYDVYPKSMLQSGEHWAKVTAKGKTVFARPADWGPHKDTGRVADLSPGLMEALGIKTDDEVEVSFPFPVPTA